MDDLTENKGMSKLREVAHFLRWRTIALRYAGKLRGLSARRAFAATRSRTATVQRIMSRGHDVGPRLSPERLEAITRIYRPRMHAAPRQDGGHPFVNLFSADDIDAENPVVRVAFSPEILDIADDYFAGRLIVDSIQVLYSWPTQGALRASQMWHKDYGDSKSFHWIAYLNDVNGPDDGPFSFIDKNDTRRIAPSMFIRRISDQTFTEELEDGQLREFLGRAGDSVFLDPAVCYHSGSRCKNPRLAIFVTFNTSNPFVAPTLLVRENRQRIFDAATRVRPDLSEAYLRRLLQIH
jgi:hypothetical protein